MYDFICHVSPPLLSPSLPGWLQQMAPPARAFLARRHCACFKGVQALGSVLFFWCYINKIELNYIIDEFNNALPTV